MSLKFKRNYPILLLLAVILSVLAFAFGHTRVIAYTTLPAATAAATTAKNAIDYTNEIDLFDDTVVHSIQVIMSDEDYEKMITTYKQTGLKEYFKADIIIDGVRINDVGIRLRGNASLRSALGGGMGGARQNRPDNQQQPGMANRAQRPENAQAPEGFAPGERLQRPDDAQATEGLEQGERPQPPANFQMPEAGQAPAAPGFSQSTAEVKIPFMVKFDKYVEGQTYQGYTTLAIRNYGASSDAAMLQEPLTNLAAQLAGLPATDTAYTGFRFNDDEEKLYVISELVNEGYLAKYFETSSGILYKAEVGSTLKYQGEDPSSYADSFSQKTRLNDADLKPLIAFMRFLDQADDAEFERELPKYLDVDAFATYLAVNALLVNTDSVIGMNNNYYLYYDDLSGQFTLLMWDANESFGKLGGSATYDVSLQGGQGGAGRMGGGRGGGMGGGTNTLLSRFLANSTFKALYEEKLEEVYQKAFVEGAMTAAAGRYSALIHSVNDERNLVDISAYDQAVDKILTFIDQRIEYLKSTELLGQASP